MRKDTCDEFLVARVLHLVIGRPFSAPTIFVLQSDPDLPDDLAEQVQRHIDVLELQRRYGPFIRDEICPNASALA